MEMFFLLPSPPCGERMGEGERGTGRYIDQQFSRKPTLEATHV
jgi:hypothetical protein